MSIKGTKREGFETKELRVGFLEGKIIAINPTREEFNDILDIELKDDSKAADYLGESKDNNTTLRLDFWFEDVKTKNRDKVTFFLENKPKENKDSTKKQYINNQGACSWADDPNNLPDWFLKTDNYRQAYQGEEEFYTFAKYWLAGIDTREGEFSFDWKPLMKGNIKELKEMLGSEYQRTVGFLMEVKSVDKDGEVKNYQSVYNKAFLYPSDIKFFNLVDYSKDDVVNGLKNKKSKELKRHERFVLSVLGEYGSKNSFVLKPAKLYNPDEFLVANNEPISTDGSDY